MVILIVVLVLLVVWVIGTYNGLIQSRNKVKNAWSQIDVQLQRRFDLIPNLVETVKGYMENENSVLEKVRKILLHCNTVTAFRPSHI